MPFQNELNNNEDDRLSGRKTRVSNTYVAASPNILFGNTIQYLVCLFCFSIK